MNLLPPSREGLMPLTRKGGAKLLIFRRKEEFYVVIAFHIYALLTQINPCHSVLLTQYMNRCLADDELQALLSDRSIVSKRRGHNGVKTRSRYVKSNDHKV